MYVHTCMYLMTSYVNAVLGIENLRCPVGIHVGCSFIGTQRYSAGGILKFLVCVSVYKNICKFKKYSNVLSLFLIISVIWK